MRNIEITCHCYNLLCTANIVISLFLGSSAVKECLVANVLQTFFVKLLECCCVDSLKKEIKIHQ